MIKAILLDLGNVVVGLDFPKAYRAAAELTGRRVKEIPELIRQAQLTEPYEHGEISSEEFYRRFSAAVGLKISFDEFRLLWGDMFQPEPILEETFIESLRKNHPLVLLSNTNELHFEWIRRRYPIVRHFDKHVLSYRVGSMKPDSKIFHEAIQAAGCAAEQCFFTDDKEENIRAALELGIDAVTFTDPAALQEALRQRGLKW